MRSGAIYHLISRFVGNEWFMASEVERRTYLFLLQRAIEKTDWRILAYALMSSHIHLAFVAGKGRLRDWLAPMHTDFALWINERLERIGGVFVRGPTVHEFSPSGVGRLINYIHCNPVRAGVIVDPSQNDWTSHRAYLGMARRPAWLDVERGLELSGFTSPFDLEDWMHTVRIEKEALNQMRVVPPRPRGRPRRVVEPAPTSRLILRAA